MDKQRFIELLTKKEAGEITPPELQELERLKISHPEITVLQELVETLQFKQETQQNSRVWNRIILEISRDVKPINLKPHRKLNYYRLTAAAVLIGIAMISAILFFITKNKIQSPKDSSLATQKGAKSNIVLPDGTKVWLNSDSKLTYPKEFELQNREVQLSGEAYFEVVRDTKHPFIVHTNSIDVKVLGTVFNVRDYQNENTIQTTLLKGAVEVFVKNNNRKISLSPNEKLIVPQNINPSKPSSEGGNEQTIPEIQLVSIAPDIKDSSFSETEWMHGRIVFNRERINEIIPVLERWYNIKIVYHGTFSNKTFSGSFRNASLEDILKTLQLSGDINYKIEKDRVIIY